MNFKKQLREGLLTNNPVVGQLLGMCSTMAITTTLFNGLGMGLSVTLILICSNVVISLLRKVIPDKIRIAAYIVVIAGFVTIIDLLLQAYLEQQIEAFRREEARLLPEDADYASIAGLRLEARQKLADIRPRSIGQAGRISGVSPADIAVLLIWLSQRNENSTDHAE